MSDEAPIAPAAAPQTEDLPATPPVPEPVFPPIKRQLYDVLYDDSRNEVWIGVKLRQTLKGRTRPDGPIEDVEVNIDGVSCIVALDGAKQEILVALGRDSQALAEKRARQQALKGNGILDRLTAGLGKAFSGRPS